jgi:putative tricarboxylic transport membrane protein
MFERALNAFWILLGAAAASYAWTIGLVSASGPESGLFPLIAGLIIMGSGLVLLFRPSTRAAAPDFPRGAALGRILGVVAGLAVMAIGMPYLGFAVTGAVTMIILLRTVEDTGWVAAIGLALASVVAVVWLFGHVLGMVLPRGPWGW